MQGKEEEQITQKFTLKQIQLAFPQHQSSASFSTPIQDGNQECVVLNFEKKIQKVLL